LVGFVHTFMGQLDPARRAFDSALNLLEKEAAERPDDARVRSALGLLHAGLGLSEEAVREGQRAVDLYPVSKDAVHGPSHVDNLARIYTLIGDQEAALDTIEYLLTIPHGMTAAMLRLDPRWDSLRSHPRFREFLNSDA
jgi:Flp pilus assembly protein TadD